MAGEHFKTLCMIGVLVGDEHRPDTADIKGIVQQSALQLSVGYAAVHKQSEGGIADVGAVALAR